MVYNIRINYGILLLRTMPVVIMIYIYSYFIFVYEFNLVNCIMYSHTNHLFRT